MVFLLIIMSISKIHALSPLLAKFRPALTLALLAGLYAIANPRSLAVGNLLTTWPAKVIAGLGVMACLSVPFGLSMGASGLFIITEYSKVLVVAFLVIATIRTMSDLYTYVWAYVIGTACLAYLAIFVFKTSKALNGRDIERISGGFSFDANDICVIALIGMAFTLLAFQIGRTRARIFCLVVLVGIGMLIARSGSRGGFLGLVAVGGALFVLVKTVSMPKKLGVVALLGLGLFLSAPAGYVDQMLTILNPSADYNMTSQTGRMEIWKRGLGYMLSHPLTGIGVDNYQRAEGTIADIAVAAHEEMDGVRWNAAHSTLVQAGAEMGIPGLVLMMILMYRGIPELLRLHHRLPKGWAKGDAEERFMYQASIFLPVALIAFGVSGLLVSHAYIEPVYILGGFQAAFRPLVEARMNQSLTAAGSEAAPPGHYQPVPRYRGGLPPHGVIVPRR